MFLQFVLTRKTWRFCLIEFSNERPEILRRRSDRFLVVKKNFFLRKPRINEISKTQTQKLKLERENFDSIEKIQKRTCSIAWSTRFEIIRFAQGFLRVYWHFSLKNSSKTKFDIQRSFFFSPIELKLILLPILKAERKFSRKKEEKRENLSHAARLDENEKIRKKLGRFFREISEKFNSIRFDEENSTYR